MGVVNITDLAEEGYGLYPPVALAGDTGFCFSTGFAGCWGCAGAALAAGAWGAAGAESGLSALGMSTSSGFGISGLGAFAKGLVFLSCSEVAKSRPLPEENTLSLPGLGSNLLISSSISLKLGIASLEGSGALDVSIGLSNVPPSLGKTGSEDLGSGAGSNFIPELSSNLGSVFSGSGALKGLNAEIDASNSKSSNSSLKPLSVEENWKASEAGFTSSIFLSRFSLVSFNLSETDSALSPGLNWIAKEESTKSSLPLGVFIPLLFLKSSGSLGMRLNSFFI